MDVIKSSGLLKHGLLPLHNPRVLETVMDLLTTDVQDGFFTAPASSSGKYHPPWQNEPSGLLRHTVEVLVLLPRICDMWEAFHEQDWRDMVTAGAVLHDAYKNGVPWGERTHPEHEILAADAWTFAARRHGVSYPMSEGIRTVILHHSGRWSPAVEKAVGPEMFPPALAMHIADMVSSDNALATLFIPRPLE